MLVRPLTRASRAIRVVYSTSSTTFVAPVRAWRTAFRGFAGKSDAAGGGTGDELMSDGESQLHEPHLGNPPKSSQLFGPSLFPVQDPEAEPRFLEMVKMNFDQAAKHSTVSDGCPVRRLDDRSHGANARQNRVH